MTYSSVFDLTKFIVSKHSHFAGHKCSPSGVRVYDTLMRVKDFLKSDPAAIYCIFDATLDPALVGGQVVNTQIRISLDGEGMRYEETTKEFCDF